MHQPNSFVNTYLGYQMWDYETDGELLWPAEQRYPDRSTRRRRCNLANFEPMHDEPRPQSRGSGGARPVDRQRTSSPRSAASTPRPRRPPSPTITATAGSSAPSTSRTARATCSTRTARSSTRTIPKKFDKAVHLKDIHLEKGMHCVDCHFQQDVHGERQDLRRVSRRGRDRLRRLPRHHQHGARTVTTSGPAAPSGGTNLLDRPHALGRAPLRVDRRRADPALDAEGRARVGGAAGARHHRPALAALQREGAPREDHADRRQDLGRRRRRRPTASRTATTRWPAITCHTSWVTSCFGCHLPQQANWKKDMKHFEGGETRNWTSYNPAGDPPRHLHARPCTAR